jgi:hypothetical protein
MTLARLALVIAAALICAPALSQIRPCEELKSEIEAKLRDMDVVAYTLEIVPADVEAPDMKVVGICNGGKNKIIYVGGIAAPKEKTRATREVTMNKGNSSEEPMIRVLNPMGTPPPIMTRQMAPRMEILEGKTIYFLNTGYVGTDRLMAEMMAWFKENYPKTNLVLKSASMDSIPQQLLTEIGQQADGVIVGLGH